MPLQLPGPLVSASWLYEHLHHPDLVVLDASWHMPGTDTDPLHDWQRCRIEGSAFFDIDGAFSAADSPWPHMLPTSQEFEYQARRLGINSSSAIVVYDAQGVFSSPRAWWMFRAMGHRTVAVLDGGLPAWRKQCEVATGVPPVRWERGNFAAQLCVTAIAHCSDVQTQLQNNGVVLDARANARFRGEQSEPRPGLRRGHMPGASNLPYQQVLKDGYMKSRDELVALFSQYASDEQGLITSCGSGITACVLALAAEVSGVNNVRVYDGSWAQWGGDPKLPVVTDHSA